MRKLTPEEREMAQIFERGVECGRKEALKWRPISEAPMDGTVVDLWAGGKRRADCYWEDYGDPRDTDAHWRQMYSEVFGPSFSLDHTPTYFMPLPPSPEGEK